MQQIQRSFVFAKVDTSRFSSAAISIAQPVFDCNNRPLRWHPISSLESQLSSVVVKAIIQTTRQPEPEWIPVIARARIDNRFSEVSLRDGHRH